MSEEAPLSRRATWWTRLTPCVVSQPPLENVCQTGCDTCGMPHDCVATTEESSAAGFESACLDSAQRALDAADDHLAQMQALHSVLYVIHGEIGSHFRLRPKGGGAASVATLSAAGAFGSGMRFRACSPSEQGHVHFEVSVGGITSRTPVGNVPTSSSNIFWMQDGCVPIPVAFYREDDSEMAAVHAADPAGLSPRVVLLVAPGTSNGGVSTP